ncbi:tyrosine-type recombinase/integrase [Nocardia tengchongensis]|uniref:tyrosine-type recombinase/integrase n=1 Tax=Nocardia tengchongensis TaxID=2055889 RepID=UPI003662511C
MKGSVRQRGKTWGYRFRNPMPDPVSGKREWVTEDGFRTEREAWKACRKAITEAENGRHVANSRCTMREFLIDEWLPAIKLVVDATTYDNWKNYTNAYVVPHLGDVRVQQITDRKLIAFYALLLERGRVKTDNNIRMYRFWVEQVAAGIDPRPMDIVRECGVGYHAARAAVRRYRQGRVPTELNPGLSPKSVRSVHTMLHRAFADAKQWKFVTVNPVSGVKPPRVGRRRPTVWTAEQVRRFLLHVRTDRFYPLFLLAATTGMRRSELCGLRWEAVDLDGGYLSMQEARVVVSGRAQSSDGKSEGSRRRTALDRRTITALRAWQAVQSIEQEGFGDHYDQGGFVFTWEDGRPVHPDSIRERFVTWAAEVGLPPIRLHDMRHSYATNSLRNGINPKVVSERIGHASVAFTLDVYSHVLPGVDRDAAEQMAALMLGDLDGEDDSGELV